MKALRNPESNMKIPAHWFAIGVMALSLGITGCKHGPQGRETILGRGPDGIPDDKSNPTGITNAPQTVTPVPPIQDTGPSLPAALGDWDNPAKWTPNRDEFKDQTVYFDLDRKSVV